VTGGECGHGGKCLLSNHEASQPYCAICRNRKLEEEAEKSREKAATYRGMYEGQKEYYDKVVVNFFKMEIERDMLLKRVGVWEEFCRDWAAE